MHAQRMHNTHPIRGSLKMHGAARRFFFFDKAYLKHPKVSVLLIWVLVGDGMV